MDELKERITRFSAFVTLERGLSKNSRRLYAQIAATMLKRIGTLDPTIDQMRDYVLATIESEASFSHVTNVMRTAEVYAQFRGKELRFHRPRKPHTIVRDALSEAEVVLVLAACKNVRERAILTLFANSGIRTHELCGAQDDDINFNENSIRVRGKGQREGTCFFGASCAGVLKDYLAEYPRGKKDFLFTSLRHNEQITTWGIRKIVKTVAKRSPVQKHVYPYSFRHSLATNMLERGANLMTIKEQLRHQWINTTMLYVYSRKDHVKAEYELYRPRYQ